MKSLRSTVLSVLARHLEHPEPTLHLWTDLERDLDVTPLEVALVALEIEAIEKVDLHVAALVGARTVAELLNAFTSEVERARLARGDLDVA
jgi:hypothetical protein